MATPAFNINAASVLSALAAIAGTVIYLTQFSESGKLSLSERFDAIPDVDSHLQTIEGLKYRDDGAIAYRWRADSADRMISSGDVHLSKPYYIGNIGEQRPWTAQAINGTLSQNGQQLTLRQQVLVEDLIHEAEIRTEQLSIDLERSIVSTDQPLNLQLPNGQTRSVGMKADLQQEKVELLSQVKGRYEPL
ncbi:LPS export ABC transporter periplasmic protein LptC [Spongiibacter sp.]|uniref:LPS export ABC transporter periplasmic protein LptC n=1 Tax=Spongiibacter sp. TaxID=2024860 RepID=UPI0035687543